MRVISYECHNVKRVSDIKFDLEGRHLFLVGGKNGQGKSSSLDGLLMALCGRSGMDYPEIALKDGENEGWVKVSLSGESEELHQPGGMTVELRLLRKRTGVVVEEFKILDSDGEEAPEPRTLLKRLYSLRSFDPLSFARMDKKSRKAMIEQLLDLDFTEERAKWKAIYEDRTSVNRDVSKAKAQLDGMPLHGDIEEVSATELMTELDRRNRVNEENRATRFKSEEAARKLTTAAGVVASIQDRIAKLEAELASAEAAVNALSESSAKLSAESAALVDEETDSIRVQIRDVDANNAKARANKLRAETLKRYNDLSEEADTLTEKLKKIDDSVKKRTAEAEFPVPGMSLDAEGILFNGLPFEQASKREQIEASVDIGIALNPLLRLMVSQDGGALDDEAIETLDKKLANSDFQMVVEIATRSSSDEDLCAVVIKDGKVAKSNPAKKSPTLFADATA